MLLFIIIRSILLILHNVKASSASQRMGTDAIGDFTSCVFSTSYPNTTLADSPSPTAVHSLPETDEAYVFTDDCWTATLQIPVSGKSNISPSFPVSFSFQDPSHYTNPNALYTFPSVLRNGTYGPRNIPFFFSQTQSMHFITRPSKHSGSKWDIPRICRYSLSPHQSQINHMIPGKFQMLEI